MEEKESHAKTRMLTQHKSNHWKDMIKETSKYQLNISVPRREKTDKFHLLPQKTSSEATLCEATLSMQDQICKAETLLAMKTAKEDFPVWASDGVPQLFQRMFQYIVVAQKMTVTPRYLIYWSWTGAILSTENH